MQDDLIQHTHEGIAEDPARFVILDELAVKREELARELATVEEPAVDFQEKIEKLKAQRGGSGNLHSGDKWSFCLTSA